MVQEYTSVMERPHDTQHAAAGVKTILLLVQSDEAFEQRFQTALSLSRACEAHLTCLHVTPIEAYVAFDSFGGVFVMNDVIETIQNEELRLRQKVELELRREDVAWDYAQVCGNVATQIIRYGALTDLLIVGREPHRQDFAGPTISLLGDLLHRSGTPLFIPSTDNRPPDVAGTAIIAWKASHEAANAVRSAVGLLKIASDVRVVEIAEAEKDGHFPGKRLLEYLSRHGIHADLHVEPAKHDEGSAVADVLVAHATSAGASYMVMGGYGHSRVGEFLFGGVTRALLADCPVPLLIAH